MAGMVGINGTLQEVESFENRCAVIHNEDEADVDQGLASKSIECSVFHDYVCGEKDIH